LVSFSGGSRIFLLLTERELEDVLDLSVYVVGKDPLPWGKSEDREGGERE
jgi:hypothetical protein